MSEIQISFGSILEVSGGRYSSSQVMVTTIEGNVTFGAVSYYPNGNDRGAQVGHLSGSTFDADVIGFITQFDPQTAMSLLSAAWSIQTGGDDLPHGLRTEYERTSQLGSRPLRT